MPGGAIIDDLVLVPGAAVEASPGELAVTVASVSASSAGALYGPPGSASDDAPTFTVPAIPFSTWGNAAPGAMRVWIPVRP